MARLTIFETFDDHWVATPGPLDTPCHIWQRARKGKEAAAGGGYGCFTKGGKRFAAHRFAYERVHGTLPPGLQVMHLCHDTLCVNAAHLARGTNDENQAMRAVAGRGPRRLSEANVRQIRFDYATGVSQSTLAKQHKLHQADVSNIVNRKYWKHVA